MPQIKYSMASSEHKKILLQMQRLINQQPSYEIKWILIHTSTKIWAHVNPVNAISKKLDWVE